jgi:hypothetical protein
MTEVICWLKPAQMLRIKNENPNINISREGKKTVFNEKLISLNLIITTGIRTIKSGRVKRIIMIEKSSILNR